MYGHSYLVQMYINMSMSYVVISQSRLWPQQDNINRE